MSIEERSRAALRSSEFTKAVNLQLPEDALSRGFPGFHHFIRAIAAHSPSDAGKVKRTRRKGQTDTTMMEISKTQLGFLGLGLMGSRLSSRLHANGWQVQAWNRSPRKDEQTAGQGVARAASLASLCATADVILSCLANDEAVQQVYFDPSGVLESARPGSILLEMSTISWALSQELHREAARRRLRMLDLPIAGSTPAVEAGTITLLAGGDQATFEACTPIFETLARQWFLVGPGGSGVKMKLVVNLLLGVGMAAIAEALSLGRHLDLPQSVLLDVLSHSAAVAPAFLGKFPKIGNGDYSPEFPLRLMSKDLKLVSNAAPSAATPLAAAAERLFAARVDSIGDLDLSALASESSDGMAPSATAAQDGNAASRAS